MTAVDGAGAQFGLLRAADMATVFEPLDLTAVPSYADGDEALRVRVSDGPNASVYLKAGDAVYEVFSKQDATAVAEAIMAQIR